MAEFKITAQRLKQIKDRQWSPRWGKDYVASIFADPKEAPGISTGTVLRPVKFGEREFHTLSRPETNVSLLALHHDRCWELHEQKVLFPTPRPHYLYGHPRAAGSTFASFAGTLVVAEKLGLLSRHPKVRLQIGTDSRRWPMAPFPFIGDLLLFMHDDVGPYCINWPVKNKFADFRRAGPRAKPRPLLDPDDPAVEARQALERTYYDDACIRTQHVADEGIPFDLRCNLRTTFLDDSFPVPLDVNVRPAALEKIRAYIGRDVPAYSVARAVAKEFQISDRQATALIHQGIWRRELRIDLFRPFLMNKPLRPERVDVLVHYAGWFSR